VTEGKMRGGEGNNERRNSKAMEEGKGMKNGRE
jgi:hypothetical protein